MESFAQNICWTFNNPSIDDIEDIKQMLKEKTVYSVFGKEVANSGTLHLQGYSELSRSPRMRLKKFKSFFPRDECHVERRLGNGVQASDYCKKGAQSHDEWELDGSKGLNFGMASAVFEHGEMKTSLAGKRTDIESVRDRMLSGEIKNEFDLLMNVKSLQALRFGQTFLNNMPVPVVRERPLVYWLHGPTGSGKSLGCAKIIQRLVDKREWSFWRSNGCPKWFDGYNRQEIAWFDDYRFTGAQSDFAYMLNLLDVYPLRVPIKGGFVTWCPRVILFTSPVDIPRSFSSIGDREDLSQMERRVSRSFDFADAGASALAVAIWSYMEDSSKHHAPVQKFGECKRMETDDEDSDYDALSMELIHEDSGYDTDEFSE